MTTQTSTTLTELLAQLGDRKATYDPEMDNLLNGSLDEQVADMVNHPSHYKKNAYETIDEMRIIFGDEAVILYCKINAWKYKSRAPYKGKMEEDLAKADWYMTCAKTLEDNLDADHFVPYSKIGKEEDQK